MRSAGGDTSRPSWVEETGRLSLTELLADIGIDIPNAFIQTKVADKKNQVVIRIRGMVAEILVKIAPEIYGPFIGKDKKGQSISNLWNNGSQLVVL